VVIHRDQLGGVPRRRLVCNQRATELSGAGAFEKGRGPRKTPTETIKTSHSPVFWDITPCQSLFRRNISPPSSVYKLRKNPASKQYSLYFLLSGLFFRNKDGDVYLSNIYPRSQLRNYWCYFSLSSQHVSAPSGHHQVKYNYITYISRESYRYYNVISLIYDKIYK
jgi:hypothetical protein